METIHKREAWTKGKLVGQKATLGVAILFR